MGDFLNIRGMDLPEEFNMYPLRSQPAVAPYNSGYAYHSPPPDVVPHDGVQSGF